MLPLRSWPSPRGGAAWIPVVAATMGLLLLGPAPSGAQCAIPEFVDPPSLPVAGDGPRDIAFADFDRDGHLDVATADYSGRVVTVNWGKGDGNWEPPVTTIPITPYFGPVALAVGDIDRSGTSDLVVALLDSQSILPATKDATGRTFTVKNALSVDNSPLDIGLGDFDRDGDLDVVTAGASGKAQFARNDGTGAFSLWLGVTPTPGSQIDALGVADFNRDGYQDVVLARSTAKDVVFLLDDKAGGYAERIFGTPNGGQPVDLAVGDVDRDGGLDVVLAVKDLNEIGVLLGDGAGDFPGSQLFDVGTPQEGVALGDLDNDGILDVLASGAGDYITGVGEGSGKFTGLKYWGPGSPRGRVAVGDIDADHFLDIGGVDPGGILSVLMAVPASPCPKASFARAGRQQLPVNVGNAWAIASGDWDGDAVPDLAVAGNSGVAILRGDGALRFAAPSSIVLPSTSSPNDRRALVVADFNLDLRPDLATVNPSSGAANDDAITVLLNMGGGAFAAPQYLLLPNGTNPWGVVAGDFNRDGAPDLVSADRGALSLRFFPGQGDGTFGAPITTVIGVSGITAIAAGLIDADGTLDVAVTSTPSSVRWYRGDGAGGFTLGGTHSVGSSPLSVDLGDLSGDGRPDLAVANQVGDSVTVLLNTGGAFGPPSTYPAGDEPYWVRIGPADTDGDADLVVATRFAISVTVLLNNGSGSFPASTVVGGYYRPTAALLVDVDRNTKPDLVTVCFSSIGVVHAVPGDGAGGFGPDEVAPGNDNRLLASGDFDRDGRPDLVVFDWTSSNMAYLDGQGDGTFAAPALVPTGTVRPGSVGLGDFDRDGTLDLVVADNATTGVRFLAGDGAGGFASPVAVTTTGSGTFIHHTAVGDFDRDGALDFIKVTGGAAGTVIVHYGNGAGSFVLGVTTAVQQDPGDIVVLDFNRDGFLDLAVSNFNSNTISLLEGRGSRASPWTPRGPLPAGPGPAGLAVGDFDGDGFTDLAVSHLLSSPATVGFFRGTGIAPTFFAARDDYPVSSADVEPDSLAAADVNADGRLDLLLSCRGGGDPRGAITVLAGTGDPAPGLAFLAADDWVVKRRFPSAIEVADFDRDGRPDFATGEIQFSTPNKISVVLNSNCESRRLRVNRQVSQCNAPSTLFATQPAIQVEDDAANPIQCDASPVAASIIPGTGTPGAALLGATPLGPVNGVADWAFAVPPLSIDLAGKKYELEFQHPEAGLTFSRTFSQAPPIAMTGPADYCAADPGMFSADAGFDTYFWYVDVTGPLGLAPDVTIPGGAFIAGGHVVGVQATADTCPAGVNQPLTLYADLSSVVVTPGSTVTVCGSCSGPSLAVSETGGGPTTTRKWGYRATSGVGPLTYLPAQTGTSYVVNGADFPGQGTYYLAVETTPQCGAVTESNEVQVDVTSAATPADVVQVLTTRSTDGLNRLEWVYPPSLSKVRIRYRTSPSWATCVPPENDTVGFVDIPDQPGVAGMKGAYDHGTLAPLTNGSTYCYAVFAEIAPSVYSTNARTVKGRPFVTGPVAWAFSMGTMTLSAPGLGSGVLHAVANDDFLHSMVKAGGVGEGAWPPAWTPYLATGPSQSRPANVSFSPAPPSAVVYLGSQAPAGNNAVGVDADSGAGLWGQTLGKPVQAGPAGIFTAYGGAIDAILFGTRDSGGPNGFYALDPSNLNPLPAPWPYTGETGNEIGIVSSQAAVDYASHTAIFTSYQYTAGTTDSVWCVDLSTADRCPLWIAGGTASLGDVAASPTRRGGRVYVSPIAGVDGEIQALDASDGTVAWPGAPFTPMDGQIKQFILPDFGSTDLYFSTTSTVWAIRDDGSSASEKWRCTSIPNPSQPVFYAGTGRVYVGGGDGKLYVLDAADGSELVPAITVGEPGFTALGAPTVDQAGGFVYVGSDAGVVYAVAIP